MLRAIVEEAAALASLVLFLGMIAIWTEVIATPDPAAPAIQVSGAFKGAIRQHAQVLEQWPTSRSHRRPA